MARCYLCGTEATDPAKGPSRWARAVIEGDQVLVCPSCQHAHPEWVDAAESCPVCGSKKLFKSMGDKICRSCGHHQSEDEFRLS